ncbi:MAG: hypothetical protein QOH57_4172, partial [Mycobacterium sp.]|nr:hypothetical protein [Mycobacterium sp.]
MKDRKPMIIIAALSCLAVLVAGWFLLVSPTMASAADSRAAAGKQLSTNEGLRAQIASLQGLAAQLPRQQADLNRLQQRVPS